jgi:hypothetical protein
MVNCHRNANARIALYAAERRQLEARLKGSGIYGF